MVSQAVPHTDIDREAFSKILSIPWLKSSVVPGNQWGRRLADVEMSKLAHNLLGTVLLLPSDPHNLDSEPLNDAVLIVIYRLDRQFSLGWEPFPVILTFPDGSCYEVEIPASHRLADWHSVRMSVGPSTIVRERARQTERLVPRVVFNLSAPPSKQISEVSRRQLVNCREMTNLMQCSALFLILEDEACLKEVEESGIENFAEAYAVLRSGSLRADLLRYYLLYKYGGLYYDDKSILRRSLDSPFFDSVLGPTPESGEPTSMFISICNEYPEVAFMAAKPGSAIMLKALQTGIKNVMLREYGRSPLAVTGNLMMGEVLDDGQPSKQFARLPDGVSRMSCWDENLSLVNIAWSSELIMLDKDVIWKRQAIPHFEWPRGANHYIALWNKRELYTDGNPEHRHNSFFNSPLGQLVIPMLVICGILGVAALIFSRHPQTL